MRDEDDIAAIIARFERAVLARDADAVFADYADDPVAYDLVPPLEIHGARVTDHDGLRQWFATWEGPIRMTSRPATVLVDGDLGVLFTLQNMQGIRKDEGKVDLWFRCTLAVRRIAGAWKIVHIHTSVPMAIDGSGRAETGLSPN